MRTVLLIEDEPNYAAFLMGLIAREVTLLLASTLNEGVAALKHAALRGQTVEVVLLDLSLPDSTRDETLLRFKQANPTIPIIIVSGADDPALIEKSILDNCYGFIVKGRTDSKQQIIHEIEESIRYCGWNQALKRAKESMKNANS